MTKHQRKMTAQAARYQRTILRAWKAESEDDLPPEARAALAENMAAFLDTPDPARENDWYHAMWRRIIRDRYDLAT
jgi:hypothetical protein